MIEKKNEKMKETLECMKVLENCKTILISNIWATRINEKKKWQK